jgi:hypothetical protein
MRVRAVRDVSGHHRVPGAGVEPARPFGQTRLRRPCLPSSIIRADRSAYPAGMRRLFLLLALVVVGVAVYRNRVIARHEQELAIGPYADDVPS